MIVVAHSLSVIFQHPAVATLFAFEADITSIKYGNSIVTLKNLPSDTTEEQVADYLWSSIGLNVPPECISLSQHPVTPWATVVLTRESCADFLNRVLQGATLGAYRPRAEVSQFAISRARKAER
jgi:hypothetical protein